MLTIAASIIGLIFYWFRFSWPQIKQDLEDAREGKSLVGDFRRFYVRDMRRGVHFLAVMAPFVAIGVLLDWAFGMALFRD